MEISGGIDRNANNRSSMLWQIERILLERFEKKISMPKFLLMENVRNITSHQHEKNFEEWKNSLKKMGYKNYVFALNAMDFGIPQKRVRLFMVSVYVNGNNELEKKVDEYFNGHNLKNKEYVKTLKIRKKRVESLLKVNYENPKYKAEADFNQPNKTKSRLSIYENNCHLYDGKRFLEKVVPTITTKQDRHPNSGLIDYDNGKTEKCKFRYLTPRECFLLMGFEEKDYDNIVENNFSSRSNNLFFTRDKLHKMAGNSIVVDVLVQIFKQIDYINDNILD